MTQKIRVGVLGAGAWGTTISLILSKKNDVLLWANEKRVVQEINLKNNLENTGVALIRQAASKTNDVAGDGTTTATVLAYAIIKQGMRNVAAGANPLDIKK